MSDLLVDLLEEVLGSIRKNNDDKGQYSFDCPVCSSEKDMAEGDGKGNLEVNIYKGMFNCWACGEDRGTRGKSLLNLFKKFGNKSHIKRFKLLAPETLTIDENSVKRDIIVGLPKEYIPLSNKHNSNEYELAINYLKSRRIYDKIEDFKIGFAITGNYANRIIIPSFDKDNNVNYFVSRAYGYNKLKYLNPDIPKTELIFNENKINWDATIYLVEGVFDHIPLPNSIPLLGKVLYDYLYDMLMKKANANIVICLDPDAWIRAKEIYKKLNFGRLRNKIRIVRIPKDYDISKINEVLGSKGLVKILSKAVKINESRL